MKYLIFNHSSSDEVCDEESLILLKDHAVLDRLLLVQVVPGAICALLAVAAVFQDPVAVLVLDGRLHLRDQLVVYSDVTIGRSADHQLLLAVLANPIRKK